MVYERVSESRGQSGHYGYIYQVRQATNRVFLGCSGKQNTLPDAQSYAAKCMQVRGLWKLSGGSGNRIIHSKHGLLPRNYTSHNPLFVKDTFTPNCPDSHLPLGTNLRERGSFRGYVGVENFLPLSISIDAQAPTPSIVCSAVLEFLGCHY